MPRPMSFRITAMWPTVDWLWWCIMMIQAFRSKKTSSARNTTSRMGRYSKPPRTAPSDTFTNSAVKVRLLKLLPGRLDLRPFLRAPVGFSDVSSPEALFLDTPQGFAKCLELAPVTTLIANILLLFVYTSAKWQMKSGLVVVQHASMR